MAARPEGESRHDGGCDPAAAAAAARPEGSEVSGSRVVLWSPGREGGGERRRAAPSPHPSPTLTPSPNPRTSRIFGKFPKFGGAPFGGAGPGGFHPRGNDPEPSGISAPGPGAALVGSHCCRHGRGQDPPAAAGAAGSARGRPALPAPPPAPAPLPARGRGPERHRPQPGGRGLLGIGVVPATSRRESAPGFPGASRADPPFCVVFLRPAGDGGGAGAGVAAGGAGLVPQFGRPRPLLRPARAGHCLHLAGARAGGGDGRVGAGGGSCPSNPEAPPPSLPAIHRSLPHRDLHLLADVQQLQPIADGAAPSPRPPRQTGRGPALGHAPGHAHRPRPPGQGGDPETAEKRVARGPGHARGRAAPVAPQEPPHPGGQRSSPPNFCPKPPEPAQNGALRAPKKALEGHAGLRGGGGDPQPNKKRANRDPRLIYFGEKIWGVWGILGAWGCRSEAVQNGGAL